MSNVATLVNKTCDWSGHSICQHSVLVLCSCTEWSHRQRTRSWQEEASSIISIASTSLQVVHQQKSRLRHVLYRILRSSKSDIYQLNPGSCNLDESTQSRQIYAWNILLNVYATMAVPARSCRSSDKLKHPRNLQNLSGARRQGLGRSSFGATTCSTDVSAI